MSIINRLYNFVIGTVANPDQVDAELDQLVTESNFQDSRLGAAENRLSNLESICNHNFTKADTLTTSLSSNTVTNSVVGVTLLTSKRVLITSYNVSVFTTNINSYAFLFLYLDGVQVAQVVKTNSLYAVPANFSIVTAPLSPGVHVFALVLGSSAGDNVTILPDAFVVVDELK